MSNAPIALDKRILAALEESADTLGGLSARLHADPTTVMRTLQQLGSLKQVTCRREDGALLWDVTEAALGIEPTGAASEPMVPAAQVPAAAVPPVPPVQPKPRRPARPRGTSGVTDRLRSAVSDQPWSSAGDLLARLPDIKRDVIYALLSQRVKAGEFVACPPTGRFRRYAVAGTRPPEQGAAPVVTLKPSRAVAPKVHPKLAGTASAFELCLRFIAWANALHGEPTVEQIRARFEVSRATAFRWRSAWRAAQQAVAA